MKVRDRVELVSFPVGRSSQEMPYHQESVLCQMESVHGQVLCDHLDRLEGRDDWELKRDLGAFPAHQATLHPHDPAT